MFDNIGGFMHLGETCYVEFSWRCPGEVAFGSVWHLLCLCIFLEKNFLEKNFPSSNGHFLDFGGV